LPGAVPISIRFAKSCLGLRFVIVGSLAVSFRSWINFTPYAFLTNFGSTARESFQCFGLQVGQAANPGVHATADQKFFYRITVRYYLIHQSRPAEHLCRLVRSDRRSALFRT
jgi:hypothetical protein